MPSERRRLRYSAGIKTQFCSRKTEPGGEDPQCDCGGSSQQQHIEVEITPGFSLRARPPSPGNEVDGSALFLEDASN